MMVVGPNTSIPTKATSVLFFSVHPFLVMCTPHPRMFRITTLVRLSLRLLSHAREVAPSECRAGWRVTMVAERTTRTPDEPVVGRDLPCLVREQRNTTQRCERWRLIRGDVLHVRGGLMCCRQWRLISPRHPSTTTPGKPPHIRRTGTVALVGRRTVQHSGPGTLCWTEARLFFSAVTPFIITIRVVVVCPHVNESSVRLINFSLAGGTKLLYS